MKKILLSLAYIFGLSAQSFACADDGGEDYYYYNLFNQTITNSPQYAPFLLTMDSPLFNTNDMELNDENIEDWSDYLNISYDKAYYLVLKSSKQAVDQLIKNGNVIDTQLNFADAKFIKKNKQALLYLSYAKYLEPYMSHNYIATEDIWSYVERSDKNATQLDNLEVMAVLEKSWNAETDKDLKLRYGYQMVRFAHYSNQYHEALRLFKKYVEPLNLKSVIYYYALDQKAGAERAVGNYMQANYDFFEVFSHTKNKKESAFNSMKVTQDLDYNQLLRKAKTIHEKNDLYLLIGFKEFSNPLAAMRQILNNDMDADQAKILYARAINILERHYLQQNQNGTIWSDEKVKSGKIPFITLSDYNSDISANFLNEVLAIGKKQAVIAHDKDFWNLSVAYIATLNRDFADGKTYLAKVKDSSQSYQLHKRMIEMLMDLNQLDKITPTYEETILAKYGDLFNFELIYPDEYIYGDKIFTDEQIFKDRMKSLARDILANRYFLQGDKAKAFLLHNHIDDLAANVQWDLLNDLDRLDRKSNKSEFETYLVSNLNFEIYNPENYLTTNKKSKFKLSDYIANYKGTLYLREQQYNLARVEFQKIPKYFKFESNSFYTDKMTNSYNGFGFISNGIFGYNKIECFTCPESQVIAKPYVNEFNFIPTHMNKLELTNVLIELTNLAHRKDDKGVKANYLLMNYYYNTTSLGYYRELLSFDRNNWYGPKFHSLTPSNEGKNMSDLVYVNYYKNYAWLSEEYISNFDISLKFAKVALNNVKDAELKAQILFAAAKSEQGKFYQYSDKNLIEKDEWNEDYASTKLINYKVNHFRTYFNQLKSLSFTKTYNEVKSNCVYFDTYIQL